MRPDACGGSPVCLESVYTLKLNNRPCQKQSYNHGVIKDRRGSQNWPQKIKPNRRNAQPGSKMDKFQIVLIKFSIWCRADERTARLMQQNRSIKIDFEIVQFRQWIFTKKLNRIWKKHTHIDPLAGDFEFFFFNRYETKKFVWLWRIQSKSFFGFNISAGFYSIKTNFEFACNPMSI